MNKTPILVLAIVLTFSLLAGCSNSDTKNVEDKEVTITINVWDNDTMTTTEVQRTGTYSGPLVEGVPDGNGTFTAINDDGEPWTYTGDFKNGFFDGYGSCIWTTGQQQIGTFSNGTFTPTTAELFKLLADRSDNMDVKFNISANNIAFMDEHPELFPSENEEYIDFINPEITYSAMNKNITPYEGQLYDCSYASVSQIYEDFLFGHTFTRVIAYDENRNYFMIYYDGALPDVFSKSKISFAGLPLSNTGYSNVSGGTTLVVLMAGATVTLIS